MDISDAMELEKEEPNPLLFLFKRTLETLKSLYSKDLTEKEQAQLTALLEEAMDKEDVFKRWAAIFTAFTIEKPPGVKV